MLIGCLLHRFPPPQSHQHFHVIVSWVRGMLVCPVLQFPHSDWRFGMSMRRGAFASLAFSVFATGTVACGSSSDGVSNRRLDSGNPATPDAAHQNPDAGSALMPDAPWLAPIPS